MIEVKINSNDQNKRLDKFVLKILPKAPSSFVYKLFRKKDVKVNKKPQPIDYVTKLDDVIQIYVTKEQEADFKETRNISVSSSCDFKVIYEDENILIVNKPTNLLVHEGDGKLKNDDTLTKQVLNYLIKNNSYDPKKENVFIPSLAHRIDRNTSGLVIFGKTSLALQELFEAFKDHNGMEKEYETLVCGKVTEKGKVNAKLIINGEVRLGWSKDMCRESWGKPHDINTTTGSWGVHEQWVYEYSFDDSYSIYCLYFENGVLTTIQD